MKRSIALCLCMTLLLCVCAVPVFASDAAYTPKGVLSPLLPYSGSPVTLRMFGAAAAGNDPSSPTNQVFAQLLGNIKIDWEDSTGVDGLTKLNLYLASGDLPDIFGAPLSGTANGFDMSWSSSGLFLDYYDYTEYTPNINRAKELLPSYITMHDTADGKHYYAQGMSEDYPQQVWYANMTVLNQYGIEPPSSLEELEAAMAVIHEADSSITPFASYAWGLAYYKFLLDFSLDSNTGPWNSGTYFDLAANEWKHVILNPESNYKKNITKLHEWYSNGWLNPEFTTMSGDQVADLMSSGKWAFTFAYGGSIQSDWYHLSVNEQLPIEIKVLPPLPANGATPKVDPTYYSDSSQNALIISAKTKYPELAVSYVDALISEDVADLFCWGIEGESYEVINGKKEWIASFLDGGNDAMISLGLFSMNGPNIIRWDDGRSRILRAAPDALEIIETYVPKMKTGEWISEFPPSSPTLSDDDKDEYAQIINSAKTIMDENEIKFIMGQRDLSDWDKYIGETLAVADIQAAIDMYNAAPQQPPRPDHTERNYLEP